MDELQNFISQDYNSAIDPEYQANMFLIESAMRELGHEKAPDFTPGKYDDALMKLIDSVPRE